MNLLCPNCQKMLTVPEQYAGQLMKCPLCNGTFTVPTLPEPAAVPSFSAPPPPAPPPTPPPPPPAPPGEVYPLRGEPEHAPQLPTTPSPVGYTADPEPRPPALAPVDGGITELAPAPLPRPTPSVTPPAGYAKTFTVTVSPKVLQWVPPVAVFLAFVLSYFPVSWVGVYPGGVPAVTQSAWQAASNNYTQDQDMTLFLKVVDKEPNPKALEMAEPGVSLLTLFYLLLLFPALVLTIASVVVPFLKNVRLPPAVEQLLPWRWGIVTALNAVVLLFLCLQLLLGFSLESTYTKMVDKKLEPLKEKKTTADQKAAGVQQGTAMAALERTTWLRLVVLLNLLATLCAALVFWIDTRGESRPLPRFDVMW